MSDRDNGGSASGEVALGLVQMAMNDDRGANISKAVAKVDEAARKGASIICLPELFTSRYFPQGRDAKVDAESIPGPTTKVLSERARELKVSIVGGSICEKGQDGRFYNTSVVFGPSGKILGKYRKVQIPQDESFFEKDYFSGGKAYRVFKTPLAKLGVLICFDQWYPEPARIDRLMGAQILFYPTAIGRVDGIEETEGDWEQAWEAVQRGHAISNSMVVAAVNRVGKEGRMSFWGGSFVCDQFGKILAKAGDTEAVIVATCDLELGKQVEEGWGFLRNRKPATYRKLVT
ncbi:MAG: acyltransferase [Thaumarchaeota archaeon]|nr:acyltransferase [Nitrososphaerota archaeon]